MQASHDASGVKFSLEGQQYVGIVKRMMSSMKQNFDEIKQYSLAKGDDTAKGKYVDFVQSVVGLLRQHASGICAIDPFFTDSTQFPLPANDPTYAVGKLRSYATQGGDPSTMKRLASFFQTMAEQAAIDHQQQSFAKQLELSMLGGLQGERIVDLWETLVHSVFPVFLDACMREGFGCLFAPPILMAMSNGFDGIQYLYSETHRFAELSATRFATSALAVAHRSALHIIHADPELEEPGSLRLLACIFRLATSTLPCLDYASRQPGKAHAGVPMLKSIRSSSILCAQIMTGLPQTARRDILEEPPVLQHDGIRNILNRTVAHRLETCWLKEDGKFFFTDSGRAKEIRCPSGTMEDERGAAADAIEEFHDVLDRMTGVRLE